MVGAFERFPASELIPTRKNDPTVPTKAAIVACVKEIPKPKKKPPYESANKETLAPAHGQKRDRAFPLRSDYRTPFEYAGQTPYMNRSESLFLQAIESG